MHAYKLPFAVALLAVKAAGVPTPADSQIPQEAQVPGESVASILPVTDPEIANPVEQASTEVKRQESAGAAKGGPVYVNPIRPAEKRQDEPWLSPELIAIENPGILPPNVPIPVRKRQEGFPITGPASPPLPVNLPTQKRQSVPWGGSGILPPPGFEQKTKRQDDGDIPAMDYAFFAVPGQKRQSFEELALAATEQTAASNMVEKRQDDGGIPAMDYAFFAVPGQKRQSFEELALAATEQTAANNVVEKRQVPPFNPAQMDPVVYE